MNTTKLFSFFVLFIVSVMFLTMSVNAIIYENMFDDPLGLGCYDIDTILVSEGTSPSNLVRFYTTGLGSASTNIMNISNYCEDACIGKDGDIFFITTGGNVYRFIGGAGVYDFVTDYSTAFQQLGDIGASTQDRCIVIDRDGNVYGNSGDDVYIFTYPSYSESIFYDFEYPVESLGLHEDGLLVGGAHKINSTHSKHIISLYTNSPQIIYEKTQDLDVCDYKVSLSSVYSTNTNDIYYTSYTYHALGPSHYCSLDVLNFSDNYNSSVISTFSISGDSGGISGDPSDIYIDLNGVIFLSFNHDDTIETFSTIDLQGGYSSYFQGSTGDKQLEYDTSILNTVYTAYNNDSTVELVYNIDIDLVDGFTTQDFYDSEENNLYYWIVDVIDEDGIKQKSSIINTFDDDYVIGSGWHVVSVGNLHYSANPWKAGNWSAILYEYDTKTGLRAALDNCEFEIYNQVSDTVVSDETPEIDPALDPVSRIDALLKSNAFVGLLIILACMTAFGKVGGVVGLVLGTVAGVSLAFLLNYIPAWVLFLMVLALCVVFVSKLISGFGGNN